MGTFADRLKTVRSEMNVSLETFGQLGNVTGAAQSNYERGIRTPDIQYIANLRENGVDVGYLLWNLDSPSNLKSSLSGAAPPPASDDDAIHIQLLSATGSMGPGDELMTEDVILGDVPFSLSWISRNLPRCRPAALKLVHAYGDSMRGTLDSGDFALVDTDVVEVLIDGVYVLQAHSRLFIKRVRQRLDGRYEVSSDNEAIKTSDILDGTQQICILGRVVYGWNGRRF